MDQTEQTLNQIREAAYYKWEQAGRIESDGIEFWLAAESEYGASSNGAAANPAKANVAQAAPALSSAKQTTGNDRAKRKRRL